MEFIYCKRQNIPHRQIVTQICNRSAIPVTMTEMWKANKSQTQNVKNHCNNISPDIYIIYKFQEII